MKISAEDIVMNLIVNSGDARTKAIEAIRFARAGDFEQADRRMEESREAINTAHLFQTSLIQSECREDTDSVEVSLLMVHGQDHLMNALTVQDLAAEMVELLREKG